MLISRESCWEGFAEDFEKEEVEVVEKEDTAAGTEEDIVAGIGVVDTGPYPCTMTGVAESFVKGFDKQSQVRGFLFVRS